MSFILINDDNNYTLWSLVWSPQSPYWIIKVMRWDSSYATNEVLYLKFSDDQLFHLQLKYIFQLIFSISCESSVKMSAFWDCGVQSILSQTLVKWSKSWEDYYKPGKAKLSQKMGKIWANSIDLLPACLSLCVRLSWTCWYSLQSYRLFTFLISISDKPSLCPSEHPTTGSSASIVGFWFFYKILGWRGDTGLWSGGLTLKAGGG